MAVSLFPREWIEIRQKTCGRNSTGVSLFTREWIEIMAAGELRGEPRGLPLHEGVD